MPATPRLTLTDIAAFVGQRSYERGQQYLKQNRVLQVDVLEAGPQRLRLRGQVRGSSAQVYQQEIAITQHPQGPTIDGDCTCPVGFNCKHVAAVCLRVREAELTLTSVADDDGTGLAKSWLARVAAAGAAPAEPADERLLYVLAPGTARGLAVELRISRPLKAGAGLSKGRVLPLANLQVGYNHPAWLQATDEEVIELLQSLAGRTWPMVPYLHGPVGQLALTRMVASGRCYWRDHHGGALTTSTPRQLHIGWREHADRTIAIELGCEPDADLVLTDPPMYLDPTGREVGSLHTHGLKAAQLQELKNAPRLRPGQAEAVSRILLREFPNLPLPTPTDVALTEVDGVAPVPALVLAGEPAASGVLHLLRLDFDYAGVRVPGYPAEPRSVLETDTGLVRVARDEAAEQAALATLADLGFAADPHAGPRGPQRLLAQGGDPISRATVWSALLRDGLAPLTAAGWQVVIDPSFRMHFESADWDAEIDGAEDGEAASNDWFSLRFDLDVGGRRVPLLPIIAPLVERGLDAELPAVVSIPLPPIDGDGDNDLHRFVDLPSERLRPVLQTLRELFEHLPRAQDGSIKLSRFDAPALGELAARGIALRGGERLQDLARRLLALERIATVPPPAGLTIELRLYQQHGLDWLQFLRAFDLAGILADDMGLGKTVQTLAHILVEREAGRLDRPALVIAPTSLISNWRREAARFTPALRVLTLHGAERHSAFARIPAHDLVLTTYPLLPRDRDRLVEARWHLVILDEAQTIKNPRAQAAQVVRALQTRHRLCLTGTPMENHLGELWALFDFLLPGFLGEHERFKRYWRTPIEQHGDHPRRERLARRVAPFLLRRRKQDVLAELPPKTEIIRTVALGERQAALYEGIRLSMEQRVRDAIAMQGLGRSQVTILDALLKLRQVCCDPRLLKLPAARRVEQSAKLEMLMDMVPEQLEEGRRILLFSQFTSMLALIEAELDARGIGYAKLTGQTRKRDEAIERFRSGEVDLFLISLKAGGLGLNLTEADTVILYDPWWNPAVEAQAADRAHRIGQDKPVFVYKLMTEQTVEERILALQQKKRALAEGIYREGPSDGGTAFNADDIAELFAPIAD